jgi:hypothetical protein
MTSATIASRRPFRQVFSLETAPLTAAYWGTALLFSLAFWVAIFPPLIDYPQHVAVGALLRRMADTSSAEQSLYDVNLVTYNGGFHLLLAALSFVVSPETAGRILMSVYPPAFAYAVLALVRIGSRPSWYAFLALPITFSFVVGWGFANYVLAVPFVLIAFSWWLRAHRGERGQMWKVMLASAFLSYTHVLATLCLCVMIGVTGFASFASSSDPARALLALIKLPLAVWPAVWSVVVFVRNHIHRQLGRLGRRHRRSALVQALASPAIRSETSPITATRRCSPARWPFSSFSGSGRATKHAPNRR